MTARLVFSITAIVWLLGGVGVLLVPDSFLAPFGMTLDSAGIHMARLNGAASLGLGIMLWLARNWTNWEFLRPLAIGGFVASIVALVIAAGSTVSGLMNTLGWVNVAIDALFVFGFGYLLFARKAA